ncbi:MAG: hypothetical protein HWE39_21500, partial [Oceanospirillaceae bacterium]|nr:hypothetical protein [Oceanospirillaceae bacterium]
MRYLELTWIGGNNHQGSKNMVPLKWAIKLVFLVSILLAMPAGASSILVIDETPTEIDLTPYLQILEDPEAQYGEEDLT